MSLFLAVVVFLAGALGAPAAGWDVTNRLLGLQPGRGRQVLIALAEAVVGVGTGGLAVVLVRWLAPDQTLAVVAAATAGVGVGIRRQVTAMRRTRERAADRPDEVAVIDALRTVVVYGAASRLVGVCAVLLALLVAYYGPRP
ncbi:MAG TPA: hypothetical protein VF576_07285 [Rubricoccaceae bacterium]